MHNYEKNKNKIEREQGYTLQMRYYLGESHIDKTMMGRDGNAYSATDKKLNLVLLKVTWPLYMLRLNLKICHVHTVTNHVNILET